MHPTAGARLRQRRPGRGRWLRRTLAGVVPALAVLVGTATVPAGDSAAAPSTAVLPNLVADPVTRVIATTYSDDAGTRALLRYDGFVHNQGPGTLEIRGSSRKGDEMTEVRQRVYDSTGGSQDRLNSPAPRMLYETADGHHHWHLHSAASFALWDADRSTEIVPSQKVGFCLVDSERVGSGPDEPRYTVSGSNFCEQHTPEASTVIMGVSPGWRDVYHRWLAFQWVDVSDVPPGEYSLRSDVDPDGVIIEGDGDNPPAFRDTVVPGYVARSFTTEVPWLRPSPITLRAEDFGDVDEPEFRIDEPPEHGTLLAPADTWLGADTVVYVPPPLHSGDDSFRFSARERGSEFLTDPPSATARIGVGSPPAPIEHGPATTDDAVRDEAAAHVPRPAPDVSRPLPEPDGEVIAEPQVELRHGDLLVRTIPWRAGTVTLTLHDGASSHVSCEAALPAARPYTCLLDSGLTEPDLRGTRVRAMLHADGQLLGSREIAVE
ncbi:lysyl oxidase family protein [Haloechinothrix sp. LS1_15]|uniref:lysyl oxidase family protein n=1 Tax=Haloechinothrix sp. LS1_15 TaxID=2652248 RepID=UPI002945CCC8|nr:lysyl oxidase family protein [Haloechinothrix sp. LS1_15]MDV6014352.1 hypothetical protein [Haloechinothrix sp. LS1_15]